MNAKEAAKEATKKFNDIKRERTDRFNGAFEHIADSLASIYRDMTKSRYANPNYIHFLFIVEKSNPIYARTLVNIHMEEKRLSI